jgi:hypothetical protein
VSESPTIHELQQVNGWLEEYTPFALGNEEKQVRAMAQKLDKWLAHLGQVEHDPCATIKLAVETAEKAGPFEGMMALSTSHVSKETAKKLQWEDAHVTQFEHGEHGWLIYVNPSTDPDYDWAGAGVPVDLTLLMLHAHQCGCCWLLLDANATVLPEVPTFEWCN